MAYDRYPAVDENYDFAPEVRAALAASLDLRYMVIPMTEADRNNLTADQLWNGRIVLNTTTERLNRYDSSEAYWAVVAEESDAILYFTEVQRDNLSGSALWPDRLILNTTQKRINRYDADDGVWTTILEPPDLSYSDVLTDTVTPMPTIADGAIGTSEEASRADHRHPSPAAPQTQTFTASGTWTKPVGATSVDVIIRSGGAGGMKRGSSSSGGGGGGGGCIMHTFKASDLTATVAITVGAGGLGERAPGNDLSPAQAGGLSSFGTYVSIPGGGVSTSGVVGPGGGSSFGAYYGGGNGGNASVTSAPIPGGDSVEGGGGGAGSQYAGSGSVSGGASVSAGAGGGSQNGNGSFVGGNGVIPSGGGGCGTNYGGNGARGEVIVAVHF